ncbi:MAG: RagB/SusD family nutrient uptake outer membrane protein [Bacteroidales bacterium]|nr:RagB/SusD family nutrient uptake outer membrane protein [Bacteroidales bacterium]
MKKILSTIAVAAALIMSGTSCVQDLTVTPIDPNIKLPEDVLNTPEAFNALLAKCYQGLACSSSDGEGGNPDISGVDGGYGQYLRAMFHLQCLATDEAVCCWNDQTLYDIHNLCWSTSDTFVAAAYYRVFFQVGLCNEYIRKSGESNLAFDKKAQYVAEARALRLLSYYHAIDLFGNVPFFTEANSVGSEGPDQIMRADLWDWMVKEAKDLIKGNDLPSAGNTEYGRIDKGSVNMILAKLYLNAEVWKGENHYADCASICQNLMETYKLEDNYLDLFGADNHLFTKNTTYKGKEIIFAVPQDGLNIRSYGATNYIIFACTGGDMDPMGQMGISSGWGGLTLTKAFVDKFGEDDLRANFYTEYGKEIPDISDYKSGGYKSMKYRNINHDGSAAQTEGFVDTDFPVFRAADVYLMLAECAARGAADKSSGLKALNDVRERAGLKTLDAAGLTLDNVLDERARELYHELVRRQDLIRFGKFTTADYLWDYKGGVAAGRAVDSKYNLYPLTSSDVNANATLKQNAGY